MRADKSQNIQQIQACKARGLSQSETNRETGIALRTIQTHWNETVAKADTTRVKDFRYPGPRLTPIGYRYSRWWEDPRDYVDERDGLTCEQRDALLNFMPPWDARRIQDCKARGLTIEQTAKELDVNATKTVEPFWDAVVPTERPVPPSSPEALAYLQKYGAWLTLELQAWVGL